MKKISLKKLSKVHIDKEKLPRFGSGPDSDWKFIFSSAAVLFLIILFVGLFIFFQVNNGTIFTVRATPETQAPNLNISLLQKVVTYYQGKSTNLDVIKTSKEAIVDPAQ